MSLLPCFMCDGYGHGHSSHGIGTACIVKGSYCQCHYCKCEKGHIHCKGHGHGGGYGEFQHKSEGLHSKYSFIQAKSTVMEAWKENTVIAIIASASMDLAKMVTVKDVKATKIFNSLFRLFLLIFFSRNFV